MIKLSLSLSLSLSQYVGALLRVLPYIYKMSDKGMEVGSNDNKHLSTLCTNTHP